MTTAGTADSVKKSFLGEQYLLFPEETVVLPFLFLFYYEKQG